MQEVKSPKKPLLYYYGVVLLVLLVFNLIVTPLLLKEEVAEVDYGTFMSMTEDGQVGRVEIQEQENPIICLKRSSRSPWNIPTDSFW